jgi:hypothetical protein
MLPWWFWIFPLGIAVVCVGYPVFVNRLRRK